MTYFPYTMFFCFSLVLGTILSISSSSWILIWAGLEINMLSFIPLMVISSTESHIESAMKYFLAQSLGSGFILMGGLGMFFFEFSMIPMNTLQFFLLMGTLIKLGVPPCHLWFPGIMSFISWPLCILLSTWQKIVPLLILFTIIESSNSQFIMFIIILASMVSALGGLTQTQLKPLLAYSSIGHMSWMIAGSALSLSLSFTYFIIYIITTIPLMMILHLNNFNSIKALSSVLPLNFSIAPMLLIVILSLGGVPPFLGFFPKWMIMQLTASFSYMMTFILISGAMINLFYYLNIIFIATSTSATPLLTSSMKMSPLISMTSMLTPFILLVSPLFMLF